LSDELGLNTVGSGIGHDIIAIIDENTENTIVLNEYYEANVDDYKSGEIRFPLEQLSEGKHTLTLKAWDVANNSAEKSIEFNVVNEKDIEINNLVNYPNPFTTNTEFIFQHNQPGIPLDVKLEIFTVSGKLVKSFDQIIVNEGFLSRDIRWNGRDEYGDRIGKGVYIYKLKVRSGNGSTAEKIEKLVIL
jgi:flagellar hook assembly protein FlgD